MRVRKPRLQNPVRHSRAARRARSAQLARVEKARSFLADIAEASDDAILGSTLDDKIAAWNRGAEVLFGYEAEEVMGKPLSIIVPVENQNIHDTSPTIIGKVR